MEDCNGHSFTYTFDLTINSGKAMKREKSIRGERTMSQHLDSDMICTITTIVWHKTHQVHTKEQPVLYITKNGKIAVLNKAHAGNWDWYVDKYSIILWCYTEDVLPKGDKKWTI